MLLELNKLSHEEISEITGIPIEVVEELAEQKTAQDQVFGNMMSGKNPVANPKEKQEENWQ